MTPNRRLRRAILAVGILLGACASTGTRGDAKDLDVITRGEIEALDVSTGYEVVERLRPQWLRSRAPRSHAHATAIIVVVDGLQLGSVQALRDVNAANMVSVHWLDSAQAGRLPGLGSRHIQGAIVVETQ